MTKLILIFSAFFISLSTFSQDIIVKDKAYLPRIKKQTLDGHFGIVFKGGEQRFYSAGLKDDDLITEVDGKIVYDKETFFSLYEEARSKGLVTLTIERVFLNDEGLYKYQIKKINLQIPKNEINNIQYSFKKIDEITIPEGCGKLWRKGIKISNRQSILLFSKKSYIKALILTKEGEKYMMSNKIPLTTIPKYKRSKELSVLRKKGKVYFVLTFHKSGGLYDYIRDHHVFEFDELNNDIKNLGVVENLRGEIIYFKNIKNNSEGIRVLNTKRPKSITHLDGSKIPVYPNNKQIDYFEEKIDFSDEWSFNHPLLDNESFKITMKGWSDGKYWEDLFLKKRVGEKAYHYGKKQDIPIDYRKQFSFKGFKCSYYDKILFTKNISFPDLSKSFPNDVWRYDYSVYKQFNYDKNNYDYIYSSHISAHSVISFIDIDNSVKAIRLYEDSIIILYNSNIYTK